jgi:hypothetical protein
MVTWFITGTSNAGVSNIFNAGLAATAYEGRAAYLLYLGVNPTFRPLHGDPRFQALLTRIGLATHG